MFPLTLSLNVFSYFTSIVKSPQGIWWGFPLEWCKGCAIGTRGVPILLIDNSNTFSVAFFFPALSGYATQRLPSGFVKMNRSLVLCPDNRHLQFQSFLKDPSFFFFFSNSLILSVWLFAGQIISSKEFNKKYIKDRNSVCCEVRFLKSFPRQSKRDLWQCYSYALFSFSSPPSSESDQTANLLSSRTQEKCLKVQLRGAGMLAVPSLLCLLFPLDTRLMYWIQWTTAEAHFGWFWL